MTGPDTLRELELVVERLSASLGEKLSTRIDAKAREVEERLGNDMKEIATRLGAEVDEVRAYAETETDKLDGRLDEHSRQRQDTAAAAAKEKLEEAKALALLQSSMNSIRRMGWIIATAFVTAMVSSAVAGVFFALSHFQGRSHDREAFESRVDRVGMPVCRDRMQDDQLTATSGPYREPGGGDRR